MKKYIKLFEDYKMDIMNIEDVSESYPLQNKILEIIKKYKVIIPNTDDLPWISSKKAYSSLDLIHGNGKIIRDSINPYYMEDFGDYKLIIFAYNTGLIGNYYYGYEMKLIDMSSHRQSHIEGGYENSGMSFHHYNKLFHIKVEDVILIIDPEIISNIVDDIRPVINEYVNTLD